ncbi:MAG: OsmC family protein [Verrucomicrobiales bacterium]
MVGVSVCYKGELHCEATHQPSGAVIATDAPVDNQGRGEAFSPTDMVAAALGTCMLTTMAIVARRKGIDLPGASVEVEKHMTTEGPRRIARLVTRIAIDLPPTHPERPVLEAAAHACPVHRSLHPDVQKDIEFKWTRQPA